MDLSITVKVSAEPHGNFIAKDSKLGYPHFNRYYTIRIMTLPVIALDFSASNIKRFLDNLEGITKFGIKINLDAILTLDNPDFNPFILLKSLKEEYAFEGPLFLDLKMWNGIRTMSEILRQCAACKVDIISIYPHIKIAHIKKLVELSKGLEYPTKPYFLTVLSHYDDAYCLENYHRDLPQTIRQFVDRIIQGGAEGIILPAPFLDLVEGHQILKLCPGIRKSSEVVHENGRYRLKDSLKHLDNDQHNILTPTLAKEKGASYIVMGSSIHKAADPRLALLEVLDELGLN